MTDYYTPTPPPTPTPPAPPPAPAPTPCGGRPHIWLANLCLFLALVGYDRYGRPAPMPAPAPPPVPPIPAPPDPEPAPPVPVPPGPTPSPTPDPDPVRAAARAYREALAESFAAEVDSDGLAWRDSIDESVAAMKPRVRVPHDAFVAAFDAALRARADARGRYASRRGAGAVFRAAAEGLK